MSLEGLLTLAGLLLAVLAIVDPVQRRAFLLFVPKWLVVASFILSLLLIEAPRVCELFGLVLPPIAQLASELLAFFLPLLGLWAAGRRYVRASLRSIPRGAAIALLESGLLENRFDEIRRILEENRSGLDALSSRERSLLFDGRVVGAMVKLRSFLHLDLLADLQFLRGIEQPFLAVDTVLREIVAAPLSPLHGAVIREYGGDEISIYGAEDRALIEKTLQNPAWYVAAQAHYPLLMQAMEELRSARLDVSYNGIGRHYEARQGVSSRSRCPIFLAEKTHVLAIRAAVEQDVDEDLYVTDLFDLYRHVLERSVFDPPIWNSDLANPTTPTPFSFLLREIMGDFAHLARKALAAAVRRCDSAGQPAAPGVIGHQLALSWQLSLAELARSSNNVNESFGADDFAAHFDFLLQVRLATDSYPPHELCLPVHIRVDLEQWYGVFLDPWTAPGTRAPRLEQALIRALSRLDFGKGWVAHGRDDLAAALRLAI